MAADWRADIFSFETSAEPYRSLRGARDKVWRVVALCVVYCRRRLVSYPQLVRYWAAAMYLNESSAQHRGGRVLLADSRDVIFQRVFAAQPLYVSPRVLRPLTRPFTNTQDPFTIPHDTLRPLFVFMEDYFRTYQNSGINQGHVYPCFGKDQVPMDHWGRRYPGPVSQWSPAP